MYMQRAVHHLRTYKKDTSTERQALLLKLKDWKVEPDLEFEGVSAASAPHRLSMSFPGSRMAVHHLSTYDAEEEAVFGVLFPDGDAITCVVGFRLHRPERT